MFSAPVEQPDHAARAVACAVEMDLWAQKFKAEKNAQGVLLGDTRIGVNCGCVTVGNFGGGQILDYRALGDAINTASRLETANRHFGTRVCVTGTIVAAVPAFLGRPVGRVFLMGKSEPVDVYEPLPPSVAIEQRVDDYRAAYAVLAAEDPCAAAAFETLARQYPEDRLIAFHHDRLMQGKIGAVVVMDAK